MRQHLGSSWLQVEESVSDHAMSAEVVKRLYMLGLVANVNRTLKTVVLFLFQLLLWKFSLMFMPQLQYTSKMVTKLVKPIFSGVLVIFLTLIVFLFFMVALFSTRVSDCRNLVQSMITLLGMSLGGLSNWVQFY